MPSTTTDTQMQRKINILIVLSAMILISTGIFLWLWQQEKNKFSALKEKTKPKWRIANTEQIERYMADGWTEYFKTDERTEGITYSVSFDITKLKDLVDRWDGMEIGGKRVDQVNAEFLIYGENIRTIQTNDPKKIPGVVSVCLSPYNKASGQNLYDRNDPYTRPLNLGDLHP